MRLFSEKVTPTFTSSNQNILIIKDFNEVFFDVYELEINGNKYIAEKVSEYKGNPVVNIPIVIEGRELEAPFVIQRGNFEVIFNESNSTFIGLVSSRSEEVVVEEKSKQEEVEEIIFEKKESILEEIKQARQAATKFADAIQQKNLRRLEERNYRDQEVFAESAENFKKDLLEEFLGVAENTREELFTYTQQENAKTHEYITDTITQLAEKLTRDLSDEVTAHNESAVKLFEDNISSLAKNILTDKLLKKIAINNSENNKTVNIKFETISKTLSKVLGDYEVQLDEKIKEAFNSYKSHITTLEQSDVELNDFIVKSSNKSLSRIGNVKTQLEESIDKIASELTGKITLAEDKIKEYYDERITLIEASVVDITTKDKARIIELIEESKQSILKEVSLIKSSVPSVVVEETLENKGDVDVRKIKTDLEKSISNRFTQELANVRRVIELSSGGGSVAQQFANGGTMNGVLNVTGDYLLNGISLIQILSTTPSIPNKLISGVYDVTLGTDGILNGPNSTWFINPNGTNNLTTINGIVNEINVSQIGTTYTISLPDSVVTPGDLNVTGSLFVAGSSVTINTANLSVADSLIYLATSNISNLLDIGIVGHFTSGYYQHTGLVRNHIDNKWTLFSGITSEPLTGANTINLNGPDLIIDTLKANIEGNITGTLTNNLSVIGGDSKGIDFITNNTTKLSILSSGDINISSDIEVTNLSRGVILRSPDNSRWRITINNNGALTTTKL